MQFIYDHVNQRVKPSGITSLGSSEGINKAYAQGSGTSGEINLLLLALLRRAGIDASPVLVGFRENGKALPLYPMMDQFSHTLVVASVDGETVFLDGGNRNRPVGMIRTSALNRQGWMLGEGDQCAWIPIQAPYSKDTYAYTLSADGDGALTGKFQHKAEGYSAYFDRDSEEERLKWWADEFAELSDDSPVSDYSAQNETEPNLPFSESMMLNIQGTQVSGGEKLYLSAFPYVTFDKGFFSLENRSFPVDMPYPISEKHVSTITIPEGYVVESLPESTMLSLVGDAGKLTFRSMQKENTIQLICSFIVDQTYYAPEEYGGLKYFFDLYSDKLSEQIVLTKL